MIHVRFKRINLLLLLLLLLSSTSVAPTIPVSIPLASTSQAPSIAVVPSGPPKKYVCAKCGHSTDRKHDFDNHMNLHSDITYKCDICFRVFHSNASRRTHIQTSHIRFVCNSWKMVKSHIFLQVAQRVTPYMESPLHSM